MTFVHIMSKYDGSIVASSVQPLPENTRQANAKARAFSEAHTKHNGSKIYGGQAHLFKQGVLVIDFGGEHGDHAPLQSHWHSSEIQFQSQQGHLRRTTRQPYGTCAP